MRARAAAARAAARAAHGAHDRAQSRVCTLPRADPAGRGSSRATSLKRPAGPRRARRSGRPCSRHRRLLGAASPVQRAGVPARRAHAQGRSGPTIGMTRALFDRSSRKRSRPRRPHRRCCSRAGVRCSSPSCCQRIAFVVCAAMVGAVRACGLSSRQEHGKYLRRRETPASEVPLAESRPLNVASASQAHGFDQFDRDTGWRSDPVARRHQHMVCRRRGRGPMRRARLYTSVECDCD